MIHRITCINEINVLDTDADPCLMITNPGRNECEIHGCVWDIDNSMYQ